MPITQTATRQQHLIADILQGIPRRPEVRYTGFVLVALTTIALTAGSVIVFAPGSPMFGFEVVGRGYVYEPPHAPSQTAGLQKSDRIVAIDGVPLHNRFLFAGDARVGDSVSLTFVRSDEIHEARIQLAPLDGDERILTYERLILALLFWFISTGVWLLRPGEVAARRFFLFSHIMAAYLSVETLDLLIVPASVASDVLRALIVPALAYFLVLFSSSPGTRWSRRLPGIAAGLVALLLAGYAAHLLTPAVFESSLAFWEVARVVDIAILTAVIVALILPQRIRTVAALRRRRAIVFGMVAGMLPILVFTMIARSVFGEPIFQYVWTFPFVVFIPVAFAAAVYAGEFGQVDWFINRSLVYIILTTALLAVYATAFYGITRYLAHSPPWVFAVSATVIALLAGALFRPVRRGLQRLVDRLFYGGWYDYRTFIESTTSDLSQVTNEKTLLDRLHAACAGMHNDEFGIFMRRGDWFEVVRHGHLSASQQQTRIAAASRLSEQLRRETIPVWSRDLRKWVSAERLDAEDAGALSTFDAHRWIAMVSKDVLRGIIVVRDDTEHHLPPEDLAILSTLSRQAAVACENVALLESLRERLAEVQRMNDELQEIRFRLADGREQERLHLARELHDGPVQDLYAMMHRVEGLAALDGSGVDGDLGRLRCDLAAAAAVLRGICSELRPPLLTDLGLDAALRELVTEFRSAHPDLNVSLQIATGLQSLAEPVQLALFRISQEALRNAAQHAAARSVWVRLEADAEQSVLQIWDDGRGFSVPRKLIEFGRQGHLGLLGIGERAEAIGARLTVESAPGQGTFVRVIVPAHVQVDAATTTSDEEP